MKKLFTLIAILFFFLSPLISEASHFRYGHISWTRVPGTRDVTFTVTTAWRHDFNETVALTFGDGTSSGSVLGTEILSVPNDYRVYQQQVTHTYATDGPFTVSFGSCCRISTLQNGADQSFAVSAIVCLNNNNIGSPVSTSPVVIEMNAGTANQYQINTTEPDGSPITYSTTAIAGSSYVPSVGSNVASVSSTGLISWNTTGAVSGQLYQMKISLSDGCSASETDFIIKIVACSSTPASAVISGTPTINLGQSANLSLTFNGSPPWTYRLTGTTTDITTSTSPATVSVTPTVIGPNTYTLSSVSNACGVGSVSGNATVTVNPLLVACYPFNGNAQDSKGGHDGTVSGASLTTDRAGSANSAYSFDGSNSFIQLNNPDDFKNNTYTYSAWVNPAVLPVSGDFKSILGIGSGQVLGIGFTTGPAWAVTSYYNSSPPVYDVTPASTLNVTANVWRHVTVVRSGFQVKIYVDGNLVITSNSPGTTIPTYTNTNPSVVYRATIGTKPDLNNVQFFNGKIDDVKIYNGALNDNQAKALYLAEQSCPSVESSVLAVTSLISSPACVGGNVSVSFLMNNITPNTANPIIIQLSDITGSFTNPIQIGSGVTTTIACAIPNNLTGGKYKVRAVFGASVNQVISVNALSLTLNPKITLIPTISTPNTTICNTNSITIATSGCSTNTYVWTGGLTGSSITITPSSTKSYKVVCSTPPCLGDSSTAVTITVVPKPATPNITTPNTTICSGTSQVLSATGCATGTYTWTGGFTGSSITVSPTTTKSYKTICTISNCPSDSSGIVTVTVNPKPGIPSVSSTNPTICNGGSTILTGSGCVGGSYTWSTGLVSASISVSPTTTKSYKVVCRINGCASDSSSAFTVNVIPKPASPTVSANNTTICSGVNSILTASGCVGGTYAWTGGLTGSSITVAPTATRSYKAVCIENTCSSDSSVATTITVTSSVANPTTTPASVCEGNSLIAGNGLKSTVPNCSSSGNSTTASYAGGTVGYDANLISLGSNPIATTSGIAGTITKVVVSTTWVKKGGGDQNSCGIAHNGADPSLAEMSLKLQAPDGTQIILVPSATYQGAYVGSITTIFDDASTVILSSTPFAGAVRPSGLLSVLNGKSPNGTWTLVPNDNGGGDPLCVSGFSVTITTTATPTSSNITWWDAQTGGNQVGTGAEYLPATNTLAAGIYTYYAQANCTGSVCPSARISTVLTINPRLVTPSITPSNSMICSGVSVILTVSGCTTGSTYAWTGGLSGSSVTVSPSVTKSYKVACSLNNCVSDSSAVATITVATNMYSIISGKWDLATTWSCGRIPNQNDDVTISTGHIVTIRDAFAKAKNLSNKGELAFENSTSKLTFGNAPVIPTNFALTLQPGSSDGKDADVNSYVPNNNYANVTFMNSWGWTQGGIINVKRCFIGFDLSSIPTNAVIDSAYLSLYFSQTYLNNFPGATGHVGDNSIFIKRIVSAWSEAGITWNGQPITTDTNQLIIPAATNERQDYQRMNVKNMVADMVSNPVMSHGFMIRHQTEDPYKSTILTTSEDSTPNIRPKLQVYYRLQ